MPCDSGPPLCGQRSSSANTASSAARNTAMSPCGVRTTRAPSRGISCNGPISIQFSFTVTPPPFPSPFDAAQGRSRGEGLFRLHAQLRDRADCRNGLERRKFLALHAGGALGPGILLRVLLRIAEPRRQAPAVFLIVNDGFPDEFKPHALDPGRGALEIARVLAVELQKGGAVFLHLLHGFHL